MCVIRSQLSWNQNPGYGPRQSPFSAPQLSTCIPEHDCTAGVQRVFLSNQTIINFVESDYYHSRNDIAEMTFLHGMPKIWP